MSMYSYVASVIDGMQIGDTVSIDKPAKLKAFRKFLSEISKRDHHKYTTKVKYGQLHIMRIPYHSIIEKLDND